MKKQEAIIKAYGKYWDTVQEFVNIETGKCYTSFYTVDQKIFDFRKLPKEDKSKYVFYGQNGYVLPKSLQGVENNNGWIKIESEADLPKDLIECYVYDDDGDVGYYTFGLNNEEADCIKENGITHYQPIIKPNPPVY